MVPFPLSSTQMLTLPFGTTFPLHLLSFYKLSWAVLFSSRFSAVSSPWMSLKSHLQSWHPARTPLWYFKLSSDVSNSSCQKRNSLSPESSMMLGIQQPCWSRREEVPGWSHLQLPFFSLESSKPGSYTLVSPIWTYLQNPYQFCNYR